MFSSCLDVCFCWCPGHPFGKADGVVEGTLQGHGGRVQAHQGCQPRRGVRGPDEAGISAAPERIQPKSFKKVGLCT